MFVRIYFDLLFHSLFGKKIKNKKRNYLHNRNYLIWELILCNIPSGKKYGTNIKFKCLVYWLRLAEMSH